MVARSRATRAARMKILVVDDHVLIREALRSVLRELKGETVVIVEARDARLAMRQLEQNPDLELVVLDPNMNRCKSSHVDHT